METVIFQFKAPWQHDNYQVTQFLDYTTIQLTIIQFPKKEKKYGYILQLLHQ